MDRSSLRFDRRQLPSTGGASRPSLSSKGRLPSLPTRRSSDSVFETRLDGRDQPEPREQRHSLDPVRELSDARIASELERRATLPDTSSTRGSHFDKQTSAPTYGSPLTRTPSNTSVTKADKASATTLLSASLDPRKSITASLTRPSLAPAARRTSLPSGTQGAVASGSSAEPTSTRAAAAVARRTSRSEEVPTRVSALLERASERIHASSTSSLAVPGSSGGSSAGAGAGTGAGAGVGGGKPGRAGSVTAPLSSAASPAPTGPQPSDDPRTRSIVAAADTQQVFVVLGHFGAVRPALLRRGWIERPLTLLTSRMGIDLSGVEFARGGLPSGAGAGPVDLTGGLTLDAAGALASATDDETIANMQRELAELLVEHPPDFIWGGARDDVDTRTLRPTQIINYFRRNTAITTQLGLCRCLRRPPLDLTVDPRTFFPRCHFLLDPNDISDFIEDFRIGAAAAIVQMAGTWQPPVPVLSLALKACEHYLDLQAHLQLDEAGATGTLTTSQWDALLCYHATMAACEPPDEEDSLDITDDWSSSGSSDIEDFPRPQARITKGGQKRVSFADPPPRHSRRPARPPTGRGKRGAAAESAAAASVSEPSPPPVRAKKGPAAITIPAMKDIAVVDEGAEALRDLLKGRYYGTIDKSRIESVLHQLGEADTQFHINGVANIWVVSPLSHVHSRTSHSRFHGRLENRLSRILTHLDGQDEKWVVQKYVERPLLVDGCKFHLRQIFLVTNWRPLHFWMFKMSHIHMLPARFDATKIRTPEGLAGHLCCHGNDPSDESSIWTSTQLAEYFSRNGRPRHWEDTIRPQLVDSIMAVLRSAEDHVENRLNSFELFAADFLVDERSGVWLTSVAATPWTNRCPAIPERCWPLIMEDLAKVILDRRVSRYADTGDFEFVPMRQDLGAVSLPRSTHVVSSMLPPGW